MGKRQSSYGTFFGQDGYLPYGVQKERSQPLDIRHMWKEGSRTSVLYWIALAVSWSLLSSPHDALSVEDEEFMAKQKQKKKQKMKMKRERG